MSLLDPSIEDIPVEVMVDILSRLPVKTIVQCKCVCKKWWKLVLDSYFADLHLSRSPTGFVIYHKSKLEYHNYEEDELNTHQLHLEPVTSLDLNLSPIFQDSHIILVGSVNGLVCLWQFGHIFICNPITREYMILPREQCCSGIDAFAFCCFGFGSLTRDYKVIWIFQRMHSPPNHISPEAVVYTLGTGQWRSLCLVPYRIEGFNGPFLNGHGHWTLPDEEDSPEKICAFDFDNETFALFPSPPSEAMSSKYLGVLKGCLCLCESYDDKVTAWVMKEYRIKRSWHKELVIKEAISPNLDLESLYIIEGFKDGTILIASYFSKTLLVYCPQRKTVVDSQIFNHSFMEYAYRPSFHRLQTFKNESVSVLNVKTSSTMNMYGHF